MMRPLPKHFDGTECAAARESRDCPRGHTYEEGVEDFTGWVIADADAPNDETYSTIRKAEGDLAGECEMCSSLEDMVMSKYAMRTSYGHFGVCQSCMEQFFENRHETGDSFLRPVP